MISATEIYLRLTSFPCPFQVEVNEVFLYLYFCIFIAGTLYICTEDVFPNKRLLQLVKEARSRWKALMQETNIAFMDNIFIEHAAEIVSWIFCLRMCIKMY